MFECCRWVGVWMGVGCPCPPVRNDIVTPRHLFLIIKNLEIEHLITRRHQIDKEQKINQVTNLS